MVTDQLPFHPFPNLRPCLTPPSPLKTPPPPAGKLLFCDNDWLQLVARVTCPAMPLVTEERAAAVAGLPGELGRQVVAGV